MGQNAWAGVPPGLPKSGFLRTCRQPVTVQVLGSRPPTQRAGLRLVSGPGGPQLQLVTSRREAGWISVREISASLSLSALSINKTQGGCLKDLRAVVLPMAAYPGWICQWGGRLAWWSDTHIPCHGAWSHSRLRFPTPKILARLRARMPGCPDLAHSVSMWLGSVLPGALTPHGWRLRTDVMAGKLPAAGRSQPWKAIASSAQALGVAHGATLLPSLLSVCAAARVGGQPVPPRPPLQASA